MKKTLLFISLIAFANSFSLAQIKATTDSGKTVILSEDGTWKYDEVSAITTPVSLACNDLISKHIDKMTDEVSFGTKEGIIVSKDGKNGLGIRLLKAEKTIIFSAKVVGAGSCIDEDDKVNILFRDGTKLELLINGDFNCDAEMTIYFGGVFGKKSQLLQLAI